MAMPLSALAHSRDDEIACTPDVMRLCKSAIPSQTRIVACLVQYKRYLSFACAKVFDREEPTQSVPASRNERPHPWGPKESWAPRDSSGR